MIQIGIIGGFAVAWNAQSGAVTLGDQWVTRADGQAELACSPDDALEVAYNCIERETIGKECFFHPYIAEFVA